jgi:hypothetical protein
MRYLSGVTATSHIDRQNERFTLECLRDMVEQINRSYIPVLYEHDPRIAPLGRTVGAKLIELPDGEFAVETTSQMFEESDIIPFRDDGREMPLNVPPTGRIELAYDLSYDNPEDLSDLEQLGKSLDAGLSYRRKKALEPLSVLEIVVSVALGNIAAGFLSKIGEDAWDMIKSRLAALIQRKRRQEEEYLIQFTFNVRENERVLSLDTILTSPSEEHIDQFVREGLDLLDQLAPEYMDSDPNLVKVVHTFSDGRVFISFGVRKDAVPLFPRSDRSWREARDTT